MTPLTHHRLVLVGHALGVLAGLPFALLGGVVAYRYVLFPDRRPRRRVVLSL